MLAIGAGVLVFKGGQIIVNEIRKIFTGSQGFSDAHDKLDQKLRDAGLDNKGRTKLKDLVKIGERDKNLLKSKLGSRFCYGKEREIERTK